MNCNELERYLESRGSPDLAVTGRPDFAAHAQECSTCRQWIEAEEQLHGQLRLLRDSAPSVPPALADRVMDGYRIQAEQPAMVTMSHQKGAGFPLVWRVAIAATLAIFAIVLFGSRWTVTPPPGEARHVQPAPVRAQVATPDAAAAQTVAPTKERRTLPSERKASPARTESAANFPPPDFHNLMYCDELSCSGAMDVVRISLPASTLGASAVASGSGNTISADVLVGPDGIARAIRIVN